MSYKSVLILLGLFLLSSPAWAGPECAQYFTSPRHIYSLQGQDWNQLVGEYWYHVFKKIKLDATSTVIEVGPGKMDKVGLGLSKLHFQGTLYVIEPHAPSLQEVVEKYKKILPQARIIPIATTLDQAVVLLPRKIDLLAGNHIVDDMIVGKALSSSEFQNFFSHNYEASDAQLSVAVWDRVLKNPTLKQQIVQQVIQDFETVLRQIEVQHLVLSQYPSYFQKNSQLQSTVESVSESFQLVASKLKSHHIRTSLHMEKVGQRNQDWLHLQRHRFLVQDVRTTPEALSRLNADIFVREEARHLDPKDVDVLYVNDQLLRDLGYEKLLQNRKLLNEILIANFALELVPLQKQKDPDSTNVPVYVDRQTDPLNIAMNGNRGSGRAAYVGSHFNLKGIGRTSLVRNDVNSNYGNGRLRASLALWEAVVSGVAEHDLANGAAPVLAVLYLKNIAGEYPVAIEVRVDRGALDRPTHVFETPSLHQKTDFNSIFNAFVTIEADKYIHQIVHGAWSPGNISMRGHLLDLDTVSALNGFAPQYSYTGRYLSNYFGKEYLGQLSVLQELAPHYGRNETFESLQSKFERSFEVEIAKAFLEKLGLSKRDAAVLYNLHEEFMTSLIKNFRDLNSMITPQLDRLYSFKVTDLPHVYDVSQFLRYFWSRTEDSTEQLMALLYPKDISFQEVPNRWVGDDIPQHLNILKTPEQLQEAHAVAAVFIAQMKQLSHYLKRNHIRREFLAAQSYVAYENRHYATDAYGQRLLYQLIEDYQSQKLSASQMQKTLNLFISSSHRTYKDSSQNVWTDVRVFSNGLVARQVDVQNGTFQYVLELNRLLTSQDVLDVKINGQSVPITTEVKEGHTIAMTQGLFTVADLTPTPVEVEVRFNSEVYQFQNIANVKPKRDFAISLKAEVFP